MSAPVLITGGAGYIGSHTVLALADAGRSVVVLDDLSTGNRSLVPKGIPLEIGDVRDSGFVGAVIRRHGCDSAIHLAAKIAVEESVREPLAYWSVNLEGTRSLLEACQREGVRHLVFSSTAAVYGEASEKPIGEDAPLHPLNPYGRAKLAAEWLIEDAASAWDLNYVVLRYFNVAGADPQGRSGQCGPESTHLLRIACETALGKRPGMEIFGTDYPTADGTALRDYIHVSDVASAHLRVLDHLQAQGGRLTFNLGYGRGYSVRQVIEAVERASGKKLSALESPRRAGDSAVVIADSTRIKTMLRWNPQHEDLNVIVASAYAWEGRPRSG
ncbi:MAG: UDP-glucose 4-epimerase GalE [Rhodospirillales bacterium]|nr:UDP-glucose 4-epimerase GalE [Rhodospirillales bacterium]